MPARLRRPATLLLLLALLLPALTFPAPARAAGIVVTTTDDVNGTSCTLRDALTAANTDAPVGGCGAGSGPDTITFQAGLTGTITLGSDLPTITTAIAITGPGAASLTIDRNARTTPGTLAFNLSAGSTLTLAALTIRGANYGLAFNGAATATLTGVTFTENFVGVLFNDDGTATLANTTFSDNTYGLNFDGGGVATLTDTTLSGNQYGVYFNGGGVATLINATFSGNQYGLIFFTGGTATLTNVTLSGSTDGLIFSRGGAATLTNATLSGNITSLYYDSGGAATLTNTIIAAGGGIQCALGMPTDGGGNLTDDATCFATNATTGSRVVAPGTVGLDPNGLQNNGGPTQTVALLANSPAIDAGLPSACPATDQRGVARPQGAGCDVGAFERPVAPTLAALQPNTATAGAPDTTLVLLGTGFVPVGANGGSIALLDGTALATTYLSPTQLVATIPAALLAAAGSYPVTVVTPAPGGGTSNALPFVVVAATPSPTPSPTPTPSPAPSAALTPPGLTFGPQTVGSTSATQSATLANTGTVPLAINVITVSGDFAQTNDCPASLPVSASCTIAVSFTPAVAGGRSGVLSVFDDARPSPQNVTLSGTGTAPASPSPSPSASPAPVTHTVAASAVGQGAVTPSGTTSYPQSATATYIATPAPGQTFTGWTLDGAYVGYASPLTLTVDANRTLVAAFVATPQFSDLGTLSPQDRQAVTFLAALGIVNPQGVNGSGQFQPGADVQRAQVAAFVARTFGWQKEFHANRFPDKCDPQGNCVDEELWNNVAALADYGVVGGYTDGATCASAGTTAPCYLPRDVVQRVQVVSVVARAFTKAPDLRPTGFWDRLNADNAQYTNVPNVGTQRSDLTTYRANVGTVPGQTSDANFGDPNGNGSRLYMVQVLYAAFNAQFGTDRVP